MLGNLGTFHAMSFPYFGLVDSQRLAIHKKVGLLVDRLACSHTVLGCAPCKEPLLDLFFLLVAPCYYVQARLVCAVMCYKVACIISSPEPSQVTFGTTVGVPLAKKLLKQCYDAGVNLCAPP